MSLLVIDASITLSWLLPDEASAASMAVRNHDLASAEAVWVPAHWWLEVCNSLWMAERRKRLNAAGVTQAANLILKLPVSTDPDTGDRAGRETLTLARQHGLSVYGAAYLELVLRRGAVLASLDAQLWLVAKRLGVNVVPKKLSAERALRF